MKYPAMRNAAMRTLSVPDLAGGINTRDGITDILDNQLNNVKNLWFKNGSLRTRPAAEVIGSADLLLECGPQKSSQKALNDTNTKYINTNITIAKNGRKYKLSAIAYVPEDVFPSNVTVKTFLVNGSERIVLPDVTITKTPERTVPAIRLFYACRGNTLYLFNGEEQKIHSLNVYYPTNWTIVTKENIHAPQIAIGLSAFGEESTADKAPKGTFVDAYNLIGCYYEAEYTTVNEKLLNLADTNSSHKMAYYLLNSLDVNCVDYTISVRYTASNGSVYYHSATVKETEREITEGGNTYTVTVYRAEEDKLGKDGKRIVAENNVLKFLTSGKGEDEVIATVKIGDLVHDNMTVTAPYIHPNADKVFFCSFSEWFGGNAEGISGGTRLFLAGNTKSDEKSIVLWSALNNPLYFPENGYMYVGNHNSAVTGFGKQSNLFVVFKEDEIWAAQYAYNSASAEAVESQDVIDLQASTVYFPLKTISPSIGCDLPGTIQLCSNRLVWANSDGRIYTLVAENQYSEKNIYSVSEMIRSELSSAKLDANTRSADYENCYWLFSGGSVYVMDYESYGYRYIASYSKAEDAAVRIPWWRFKFAVNQLTDVACVDNTLALIYIADFKSDQNTKQYLESSVLNPAETKDNARDYETDKIKEQHIKTSLETKVFDFGVPQFNKNIYQVDLGIRSNGGMPINVSYMNESSERITDDYISCAVNADDRSSRNIQNIQLRPSLRGCSRFGLRLECEGGMSINHIAINYKITGGAK